MLCTHYPLIVVVISSGALLRLRSLPPAVPTDSANAAVTAPPQTTP